MADTQSLAASPAAETPRRIADAYVDAVAEQNPVTAAYLGVNPGDTRQPDLSPQGFDAEADLARQALARLDALPAEAFEDPAEAACARLLRERLTAQLALHEAGDHLRSLSNIGAPIHDVRAIFSVAPSETEQDWAAHVGRMGNVAGAVRGYQATLAEGLRRDLVSGPRQVATVGTQLDSWFGESLTDEKNWYSSFAADCPADLRAQLDANAEQASVAVAEFCAWLRDTYAPVAADRPDTAGRELYTRSARFHSGADLDLDEAYAWAWTEFHRLEAELVAEADKVKPGATPREASEYLETDGHSVEGVEEIRVWLQDIMDKAIEALDGTHFDIQGKLRRVESRIAPAGSAAAPYYTQPSLDFSRPGRTWLPTMDKTTFPTWQLVSIWYHEGVPGHHLQLASWVAAADTLSRYQVTLGAVSANLEGWALYSERLMDELGFLTDPAHRLGFLDEQMMRTVRVIIDIGMHLGLTIPADSPFHPGETWTPELGSDFFAAYVGAPAEMRESEIIRYLGWPGQAIGYKLGERAWRRGRDAAKAAAEARGEEFDLKAWHMKALAQGSFGLDDLVAELSAL
ncbi:DUF885 domain-containing protein [Streptacidiphilus fuscans]|uniref:DUF885 domain-containing protein n=1 Tax=Streptacidiphilus fuscans TaxID=2789292 RepID=A0A931FCU2_9ACTN|nr:DUF885 domain-containing protein [Streptacidiphilus fuscans]MBF9067520.1 DUF885 domain-containing protein [Streptacidiphilus fuscans]